MSQPVQDPRPADRGLVLTTVLEAARRLSVQHAHGETFVTRDAISVPEIRRHAVMPIIVLVAAAGARGSASRPPCSCSPRHDRQTWADRVLGRGRGVRQGGREQRATQPSAGREILYVPIAEDGSARAATRRRARERKSAGLCPVCSFPSCCCSGLPPTPVADWSCASSGSCSRCAPAANTRSHDRRALAGLGAFASLLDANTCPPRAALPTATRCAPRSLDQSGGGLRLQAELRRCWHDSETRSCSLARAPAGRQSRGQRAPIRCRCRSAVRVCRAPRTRPPAGRGAGSRAVRTALPACREEASAREGLWWRGALRRPYRRSARRRRAHIETAPRGPSQRRCARAARALRDNPDPRVASTAVRSARLPMSRPFFPRLVDALGDGTREAARPSPSWARPWCRTSASA
jgi:hypothetical protein